NTVSSYLTLIVQALAAVAHLNAGQSRITTTLAVFDSGLDSLRLPIIPITQPSFDPLADKDSRDDSPKLQPVAPLVERYFEWVGNVKQGPPVKDEGPATFNLQLLHRTGGNEVLEIKWQLARGKQRHSTERRGVIFS
ncbi:hypothetical protein NEOLEDRAFT_1100183, partial [Neolentinus lepideus HHB14362 ss-1]